MLTNASKVRVVTEKGTDITLDITGRAAHADTGLLTEKGALGNLPAGEAYLAPLEDKGTGTIVVDGCIA
jgi:leucyl aminopeptidase (aminopeptidase T)